VWRVSALRILGFEHWLQDGASGLKDLWRTDRLIFYRKLFIIKVSTRGEQQQPTSKKKKRNMPAAQETAGGLNGFPSHLKGPMTWTGSDYEGKQELYVSSLGPEDITQIENAISHFKGAITLYTSLVITTNTTRPWGLSWNA
jgi:hypothetical protein